MHITKSRWFPGAQRAGWFQLTRHDDPDPAPAPVTDPEGGDPEGQDPEGAEQLGDAGKKALDRMKTERAAARKEAAESKRQLAELAAKVSEFEDRDKSDLDKATAKAEKAAEQAARATQRAVKAEVKALAADSMADPTDADLLGDLSRYVSADGDIDTGAIQADLAELLDRKPHLRKAAAGPKTPRPDPGQGARTPGTPSDFRSADRASLDAELAKLAPGFRLRS